MKIKIAMESSAGYIYQLVKLGLMFSAWQEGGYMVIELSGGY